MVKFRSSKSDVLKDAGLDSAAPLTKLERERQRQEQALLNSLQNDVFPKIPMPQNSEPKGKNAKIIIPSWYKRRERLTLKKELIAELLKSYSEPVQVNEKQWFKPTDNDVKEYEAQLLTIKKLKDLVLIKEIHAIKPDYTFFDKWHKLSVKKALVVSIFRRAGTKTDYVLSNYKRFATIDNKKYLMLPNCSVYDSKHKMQAYHFFEGNPMPIIYEHDIGIKTMADSSLLDKSMGFEFAEKMAQAATITSKLNLAVIFSLLALIVSAAHFIYFLKVQGVF